MAIGHGQPVGRIVTAPAAARQIDFRPSMEFPSFEVGIALLVTADKASRQPHRPTGFDKQYRKVAARPLLALPSRSRRPRVSAIAHEIFAGLIDAILKRREEGGSVAFDVVGDFLGERDRDRIEGGRVGLEVGLQLSVERSRIVVGQGQRPRFEQINKGIIRVGGDGRADLDVQAIRWG